MGYLSCKAQSSIETSKSQNPIPTRLKKQNPSKNLNEKPKKIQTFNYHDLELATNHFSDQKLLGRGSHGLVYKALLPSGQIVAVKKPSRKQIPTSNSDEFDNEILILSHIKSPRFVNLVGFTNSNNNNNNIRNDRLLVVEFMCNGTLYDNLHKNNDNNKLPNWGKRIRLALQIAKAIETLHSQFPPVIHRDIKSANVLLDRHNNARLGDFGLALRCNADDFKLLSTPPAGTIGYLDPSYVTPDNLSTKTDVFSFGILLLEMISGRKAIDIGFSPPSIVDWAIPLIRKGKLLGIYDARIAPPKDPMVRKQLAIIAAKCVRSNKERRPSMVEVVEALDRLSKVIPLHSWNGLTNPCLMVDNVGHPIGFGNGNLSSRLRGFECGNLDDVGRNGNLSSRLRGFECGNVDDVGGGRKSEFAFPLKNPRRVYSDLGFRNNLMDLMAEPDLDSEYGGEDEERIGTKSISRLGSDSGGSLVQLRRSILESRLRK